jgi:hypothetical protein
MMLVEIFIGDGKVPASLFRQRVAVEKGTIWCSWRDLGLRKAASSNSLKSRKGLVDVSSVMGLLPLHLYDD